MYSGERAISLMIVDHVAFDKLGATFEGSAIADVLDGTVQQSVSIHGSPAQTTEAGVA